MVRQLTLCLLACAAASAGAQTLNTFTNTQTGANRIALGYPVPIPVESLQPVDGFRLYQSLHAHAQDMMLVSPDMTGQVIGQTTTGREIWAYRLGDPGTLGAEGRSEPVVLIEGGIHAREWQSPEVVMGLIESFVDALDPAGLDRYLLDEVQLLAIPSINVDGFIMTQDNPTNVWIGQDITVPSQWPRDGRMRRKNLRNSDTDFNTVANHLGGVDLNRNNAPYWATSTSSTPNPSGLTHHGVAAASEPEIQALLAAAQSAPIQQLRAFVGAHSFSQVLFTITTTNQRRNTIQTGLARDFSAHHRVASIDDFPPNGKTYFLRPDNAGRGIGQTSEYFANQIQIPAWTLEIEPLNGGSDYGGFGANHDGFILPESEIRRVREQLSASHRVLLYHAAGPAAVRAVRVVDSNTGHPVYQSRWRADGSERRLVIEHSQGLAAGGDYRLVVSFDRPMRDRVNGLSQVFPGQNPSSLQPTIALVGASQRLELPTEQARWLGEPDANGDSFLAYREDSFAIDFSVPVDFPAGAAQLDVFALDLVGRALDSDPRTPVGWRLGHWTDYDAEDGTQNDVGGRDQTQSLLVSSASQISLLDGPRELVEGGDISLRFSRDGDLSSAASVNLGFVPVAGLAADTINLSWAAGEGGEKSIRLSASEDVSSEADYSVSVSVAATGASVAVESFQLAVIDNDSESLAVIRIGDTLEDQGDSGGNRLAWALAQSASAQRPLRIELAAGQTLFHPSAGMADESLRVSGVVSLIGAGAEIVAVAAQPLFAVSPGASLQIEDLRLRSTAGAMLVDNQGSAQLLRTRLENAQGAGIASSGDLVISRSSIASLETAVALSAGSADLNDSTVVGLDASSSARVSVAAGAQLSGAHLSISGPGAAFALSGSATLADSIVLGLSNCELTEGGAYSSGGGNLSQSAICGAQGTIDLIQESIDIGVFDPVTASLPPGSSLAAVAGSRCPQLDQLGAPRSGSCIPGSRSLEPVIARGLWWNPARSGHGQHIEIVNGIAFVLWYTYDANGMPLTWTAQGPLVGGVMQAPLLRWRRQEITRTPVFTEIGTLRLVFDSASNARAEWSVPGQGAGVEPLVPFHFLPDDPLQHRSGLYADFDDLGWGLTLQEEGSIAFALLYFFAADDQLRWASAQSSGGATSSLQAFGQTGTCLGCTSTPSAGFNAGKILLNDRGDGRLGFTGQVQLSVQPGGSWTKQTTLDRFAGR